VFRSYGRFSEAACESDISRLYGGIHLWTGNLEGLACGYHIGKEISLNLMRPLHDSDE
jgi:hypothetical protein